MNPEKAIAYIKLGTILAVVAGVGYTIYKAQTLVEVVTKDLNPMSDENVVYTALEKDGIPFGVRLFEFFNKDVIEAEKEALGNG